MRYLYLLVHLSAISKSMPAKNKHIPVNKLPAEKGKGIFIGRNTSNGTPHSAAVERSHRDGGHSFFLQEKGTTYIEIDFEEYKVEAPALVYMHPNQVHRLIRFDQARISSWIVTSENLQPHLVQLLEELSPAKPLSLAKAAQELLSETASLCIRIFERKQEPLYYEILEQSCNTLVALALSQFRAQTKPVHKYSRDESITKSFRSLLDKEFKSVKSPSEYARKLNISSAYLNECVKRVSGHPVSYHIQQRVILEAQRLLHHSNQSVKEIAAELGYEDYAYFVRLFGKVCGLSPLAFRHKNLE